MLLRLRRALRKSPAEIMRRVATEVRHELDRFSQPRFGQTFELSDLLRRTSAASLDALWGRLAQRDPGFGLQALSAAEYSQVCPADLERIFAAARAAMQHRISLLGSGVTELGDRIDWHRDFKAGYGWPVKFFRDIDYVNRGRPSDVKLAWELSRLQWLLPCAQAYVLTRDERYARAVRDVIEQWISANPYCMGVNWAVTMEPAIRIFTWTWLFRACCDSESWRDDGFRSRFLCCLYLHGVFTERFIERSDVNGNHFTADASALVMAGVFFGDGEEPARWRTQGLLELEREMPLQVHADGVDFEASTAYHRLVAELFLAAAVAARSAGMAVSAEYRSRLRAMAVFTATYMRRDGTAPLWGDHDDARTLPFGPQDVRDHRYLVALIGLYLDDEDLLGMFSGGLEEIAWWYGPDAVRRCIGLRTIVTSRAFPDAGVYVMRDDRSHVFIDCGPVGLAGRGGHGHNDLLSFEAHLAGHPVVTEGGCFVYTADFESRNRDRATMSHNTPIVGGREINRFQGPEFLWTLHNDARHEFVHFSVDAGRGCFIGAHDGFRDVGVKRMERAITLEFESSTLNVRDRFEGDGQDVLIPLHLAHGLAVELVAPGLATLRGESQSFVLEWAPATIAMTSSPARESVSYGVSRPIVRVEWRPERGVASMDWSIRPTA